MRILLHLLSESDHSFNQRVGIYLLNNIACQVNTDLKLLVANLGAVEMMLQVVTEILGEGYCDYVMETVWSTLWNLTDETPVICSMFLASGGVSLFLRCKVLGTVILVVTLRHCSEKVPRGGHSPG